MTALPSSPREQFGTRVTLSVDASTLTAVMINVPPNPGDYGRHSLVVFKRAGSSTDSSPGAVVIYGYQK